MKLDGKGLVGRPATEWNVFKGIKREPVHHSGFMQDSSIEHVLPDITSFHRLLSLNDDLKSLGQAGFCSLQLMYCRSS